MAVHYPVSLHEWEAIHNQILWHRVWQALFMLSLGLPFSAVTRLYSSFFYSRNQAGKLLRVSIIRVLVSTGFGALFSLVFDFGLNGLCFGFTLGACLEFYQLIVLLKKILGFIPRASKKIFVVLLGAVAGGIIARLCCSTFDLSINYTGITRIAHGLIPVAIFCVVFGASIGLAGFRGSLGKFFKSTPINASGKNPHPL